MKDQTMTKTSRMIAAALNEVSQDFYLNDPEQWLARTVLIATARKMALYLGGTSPNFNASAFIKEALGEYAPPSIEEMEALAAKIHQEHYDARGDRYATPEELKMHLDDPLANHELVRDELITRTGFDVARGRQVIAASESELRHAAAGVAETAAYNERCKASV